MGMLIHAGSVPYFWCEWQVKRACEGFILTYISLFTLLYRHTHDVLAFRYCAPGSRDSIAC